ncbi:MAG: O-antigen ligase family protein [Verrucomicrobiae bacterium]|nr:O-antigen ligase family protein [Verrucomicrobiae bacterium]
MTNPARAMQMLITYAVCIPLAIFVGYLLTDPLDYGTMGLFGLIALVLASPLFIRYHYPFLIFGLGCPATCFFLVGKPPLAQVVVLLSLGIAVIERTLNTEKRFISVPSMTWPLLYTAAMALFTAEMTGGIGLHALGGDTGGGKKYIGLFIGVATFFALISRPIPKEKRGLYLALFMLPGALGVIGDLFPFLPSPLNYINLIFPPSQQVMADNVAIGVTRFSSMGGAAGAFAIYLIAKHSIRGILRADKPFRALLVMVLLTLTMLGGFRTVLIGVVMTLTMLFFLEGLYRTRLMLVVIFGLVIGGALLVPFSDKLPYTFQRAMSFIPGLKFDPQVIADAQGSRQWREDMWRDLWPKVPQYLLLGKGYALSREDFEYMGGGNFEGLGVGLDASQQGLAIAGDYHSGPLSTLMPFGIWGAISYLWVALASLFITYRNFKYCDPQVKPFNAFLFVFTVQSIIGFLLLVGAYSEAIGGFAKTVGFSIALNWGICGPQTAPTPVPSVKPLPQPRARLLPA